ncbi:MAG: hypothetical protein HOY78_22935 [Saccharothrix sp.]|nr:hypothetical protein [Saccharothrix sp.]
MVAEPTWVRLDLALLGHRLAIGYEDSRGRVAHPGHCDDVRLRGISGVWYRCGLTEMLWPGRATTHLAALLAGEADAHRSGDDPGTIAVLVVPPQGLWSTDWAVFAGRALGELGVDREAVVVATEVDLPERRPLFPPVRVAVTTEDAPHFRRFALDFALDGMPVFLVHAVDEVGDHDIVVASGVRAIRAASGRRAPRLVIATGDPDQVERAPGWSLVVAPGPLVRTLLVEHVLRGLSCGRPLHASVGAAFRELRLPFERGEQVRLVTSVAGLAGLRLATGPTSAERGSRGTAQDHWGET